MAKWGHYGRSLQNAQLEAQILIEQFGRCGYCGISLHDQLVHWDHFLPWSYVGSSGGDNNWVAACSKCNLKKSSKVFTNITQITQFCYKMMNLHGSLAEGWAEGTEDWQKTLQAEAAPEIPLNNVLQANREANSMGSQNSESFLDPT